MNPFLILSETGSGSLDSFLASLTEVANWFIELLGTAATAVISMPILFVPMAIGFIVLAVRFITRR